MTNKYKRRRDFSTVALIFGCFVILIGIFGVVISNCSSLNNTVVPSLTGQMVKDVIIELPEEYPAIATGDTLYVVVKKQVHGQTIIDLGFKPTNHAKSSKN